MEFLKRKWYITQGSLFFTFIFFCSALESVLEKRKKNLEFSCMLKASLSSELQCNGTLQEHSQDYILCKNNTDITRNRMGFFRYSCRNFSRDIKQCLGPSY